MHHLVGIAEIADMLDRSAARAVQIAASPNFPQPVAELKMGRVWTLASVEAWIKKNPSRPRGRPSKKAAKVGRGTK